MLEDRSSVSLAPEGGARRCTSAPRRTGPPLADELLESSRRFAQSAVAAYSAESWDVFYLHLATALEHLAKSVLASADPVLIADSRGGFDTLLHLTGHGDRARIPEFAGAVKTVGLSDALERVARLIDNYKLPGPGVVHLIEVRNSLVHAGQGGRMAAEQVLGDVAGYLEQLIRARRVDPAAYWGESSDLVTDHREKRLDAIHASYRRRIRAAKDRYAATIRSMDAPTTAAFVSAVISRGINADFSEIPRDCPACGNVGVLFVGLAEPEWEPDWDYGDGQTYVAGMYVASIRIFGQEFNCRACGLALDGPDLELAGMDDSTLAAEDFDAELARRAFEPALMADAAKW